MSASQWLIVPVLLPALSGAILALGARHLALQRVLSLAACIGGLAIALYLLLLADAGTHVVHALGDWRAPFGIVLVLDRLAAMMLTLTAVLALAACIAACTGEDAQGRFFHALLQFQLMGLNGAFLTGDLFNLFVFFEVLLIASYCLLLHGQTAGRLRAGLHYVVINLVGSALFLIAAALLYAGAGTLNLADLVAKLPRLQGDARTLAQCGALVLLVVFGLKAAAFPLFLWLAPAYSNAAAPVAALFAVMTKLGVYAMVRVAPLVFAPLAGARAVDLAAWLLPIALVTMLCGALAALASRRLSALAAQLTLLSVGTLLTGCVIASANALGAALYYLVHSAIAGALLFLVCGMVVAQRGEAADWLRRSRPLSHPLATGALFMVAAMAIAGLPPLSGFVGKVLLLRVSAPHAQAAWIWATMLLTSLLAMIALTRGGIALFWQTRGEAPEAAPTRGWLAFVAPLGLLGCIVAMSIAAEPILRFTNVAAAQTIDAQSYANAVLSVGGRP